MNSTAELTAYTTQTIHSASVPTDPAYIQPALTEEEIFPNYESDLDATNSAIVTGIKEAHKEMYEKWSEAVDKNILFSQEVTNLRQLLEAIEKEFHIVQKTVKDSKGAKRSLDDYWAEARPLLNNACCQWSGFALPCAFLGLTRGAGVLRSAPSAVALVGGGQWRQRRLLPLFRNGVAIAALLHSAVETVMLPPPLPWYRHPT
ncbi:hypothetical protein Syun_028068 [Stephania yunnanensis]|uniref:Uncharacterized protein n=1 Tax=Stephania yunnanensis TaxID=152371 RepID=A0AAP0EK19_9MAGN